MHAHLGQACGREWAETVLALLRGVMQEEVHGVVDRLGKVEGGECAGGACECFVADAGMWQRWWRNI